MSFLLSLPDPDEAREWAERELSKAVYQETEPTLFDKTAQAIGEFIAGLFRPRLGDGILSPVWAVIIVAIVLAGVVVAFLIWGRPRAEYRAGRRASAEIFPDEQLSANELRTIAERALRDGEWDEALVVRFRALARGIDERGILRAPPGLTARSLAHDAREYFPAQSTALARAADLFDDVRYLRRHASADDAAAIADLDRQIAGQTPARVAKAAFA